MVNMNTFKSKKLLAFLFFLIFSVAIIIAGVVIYNNLSANQDKSTEKTQVEEVAEIEEKNIGTESAGLANPASVKCKELGGALKIEKNGQGSEYGVCEFKTGKACEEWALLREFCPVGGVIIKVDASNEQRFCLLAGGEVDEKTALCKLPDGKSCNLNRYYNGGCE